MYRENNRFGGNKRSFAPVHVGEEINVKIEAVGEKGDGIAKVKGFVIFVPNVKQGDEVKIKITKVLRKVGFGEVVSSASNGHSHESTQEDSNQERQSSDEDYDKGYDEQESQEEESSQDYEDSEDFGEEEKEE